MHCKKCLHYDVCVKLGKPSLYGINQEIGCSVYKDKTKWEEKKEPENNADRLRAMSDEEFDGCEYCKEDGEGYRKMLGAFSITNPFHGNEWFINTGHCKPRQIYFCPMCGRRLPQPPKEVKP